MYELKQKIVKAVTSEFVGARPSFYKKRYLPGHGLTKVEKHCVRIMQLLISMVCYIFIARVFDMYAFLF